MSNVQVPATINIRPTGRILRVLGDIEFDPWQCLAELIDNAFDDFLEIERAGLHWPDGFTVSVTLPDTVTPEAKIQVRDTGRGMDLETLRNSVRAGWSSNDRFDKLGLFGVGFNIATARLGRLTRVLTSRSGDTDWLGVEINLDKVGDDFDAPVIQESKATATFSSTKVDHGTIVEVTRLEPRRAGWLGKNAANIRAKLGDVYSFLLQEKHYKLYVNGVLVKPRRACCWDRSRAVSYGTGSTAEQIPAVIEIDQSLPSMDACLTCGNWQTPGLGPCGECGNPDLMQRDRRIWGWLGIQRHLHKTEFGVDFLRNGRKILLKDKRLFEWTDPNDPLAQSEVEYPVELGQGGRIIGEIHLDHLPVNYQKNAFEWSDRGWISAVKLLRGDGPLLPKRAKQAGYPPNDSPLGKLHKGYRRTDPGYRCLIPGNGTGPIHVTTLEWRDRFHKEEPEFQTDEKWWEAVVYHEAKQVGDATAAGESGDVLDELGLGEPVTPPPAKPSKDSKSRGDITTSKAKTDKDRIAEYRAKGRAVPELSKEYGLHEFGAPIEVSVFSIDGEVRDSGDFRTPVWLVRESGAKHCAFIDSKHPIFRNFGTDPADLLLLEIANFLKVRKEHAMPLAQGVAMLKEQRLADLKIDAVTLAGQARELLDDIRRRMVLPVSENPDRAWQHLTADERGLTETNLVIESSEMNLPTAQATGDFILYTPLIFTARLVEEWPEAFMDGRLFRGAYETVGTAAGKRVSVGRIVSYLYDAALLADAKMSDQVNQLARARLSLQLLRLELVTPEVAS